MNSKLLGMLGICAKAGVVKSGAWAAEDTIKSGKAKLVIVANDASDSTKKDYEGMATSNGAQIIFHCTKEELGSAIGKGERAVVVITDESLSKNLLSKISLDGED